jgi:hypothetical protein
LNAKLRNKFVNNSLLQLFYVFQAKKVVGNNEEGKQIEESIFRLPPSIFLTKHKVKLHLPTEFDGLHLSVMPTAEGDIVIVDVPVAMLYLSQMRLFGRLDVPKLAFGTPL